MCGDKFDKFYNREEGEWMLENAVVCNNGRAYHPICMEDVDWADATTTVEAAVAVDIASGQEVGGLVKVGEYEGEWRLQEQEQQCYTVESGAEEATSNKVGQLVASPADPVPAVLPTSWSGWPKGGMFGANETVSRLSLLSTAWSTRGVRNEFGRSTKASDSGDEPSQPEEARSQGWSEAFPGCCSFGSDGGDCDCVGNATAVARESIASDPCGVLQALLTGKTTVPGLKRA